MTEQTTLPLSLGLRTMSTTVRRRQWHPTPVLFPGKSNGRRSLAAVHGVAKSQTWLNVFTFTFHFHAWEKEMATHSSVLAWRIPGKGEPGGLPSMGSHRVGHDWRDLAAAAACLGSVNSAILNNGVHVKVLNRDSLNFLPNFVSYFFLLSNCCG